MIWYLVLEFAQVSAFWVWNADVIADWGQVLTTWQQCDFAVSVGYFSRHNIIVYYRRAIPCEFLQCWTSSVRLIKHSADSSSQTRYLLTRHTMFWTWGALVAFTHYTTHRILDIDILLQQLQFHEIHSKIIASKYNTVSNSHRPPHTRYQDLFLQRLQSHHIHSRNIQSKQKSNLSPNRPHQS